MSTIVITGANRGIGLELTRQYLGRGDHVVAACRKPSDDLTAAGAEVLEGIDVTTDDGARALAEGLGDRTVDVLVNNAGLLTSESLDDLDFDRIRRQFEVNTLGPLRITAALRDRLTRGAKVAVVTSRMGSIADNTSGGRYGYRISKAAVNMAFVSLARDLDGDGIAVAILHPGFVRTDMTGNQGFIDPPESAAGLIARLDDLTMDSTGTFWHSNGEVLPW